MRRHYDVIVVGTGGMGSVALYELAKRGVQALGIDPFEAGHGHGSSHGETRVIRRAYFEHPDYVPLLNRAYENWSAIEDVVNHQLFFRTGLLEIGPPSGLLISGIRAAAKLHCLEVDELSRDDCNARFPGFVVPEDSVAVFERDSGYLLVEECVRAYCRAAVGLGAELACGTRVRSWCERGGHCEVVTEQGTFFADRLIITAGAWAADLLGKFVSSLKILRKHLHWFSTNDPTYRASNGAPVFFFETIAGYYYGFPEIDAACLKVAEHSGGEPITDPAKRSNAVDRDEFVRVAAFLKQHLPMVSQNNVRHQVCMYTMSRDEHFIVDHYAGSEKVVFAAGMSGHGFKFASVIGEILVDLAVNGGSELPIGFLRSDRASLNEESR